MSQEGVERLQEAEGVYACSSLFAEQELTRKELHAIKLAQSQASHGPSVDGRWAYLKHYVRRYWQL